MERKMICKASKDRKCKFNLCSHYKEHKKNVRCTDVRYKHYSCQKCVEVKEIKFSHDYPKLHYQKTARLLTIEIRHRDDLTDKFVEYDTIYPVSCTVGVYSEEKEAYYPLPKNKYIILVFIGDELIPFTTVRRYTEERYRYYNSEIGKLFDVVVEVKK
jgi:hypothetical protein